MLLFAHLGLTLAAGRFIKWADLAFLALGSMLPDLIDKPLSFTIPELSAGRTIAHTLFFVLVLAAMAVHSKDLRWYSLCAGVMIHLGLDFMWKSPVVLFWPLFGNFPQSPERGVLDYVGMLLLNGMKNPLVGLPELLGLAYLIFIALQSRHSAKARWRLLVVRSRRMETAVQSLLHIDQIHK
jgi:hypothetical protein